MEINSNLFSRLFVYGRVGTVSTWKERCLVGSTGGTACHVKLEDPNLSSRRMTRPEVNSRCLDSLCFSGPPRHDTEPHVWCLEAKGFMAYEILVTLHSRSFFPAHSANGP